MRRDKLLSVARPGTVIHDSIDYTIDRRRAREVCGNCSEFLEDHVEDKCLYGPTVFRMASLEEVGQFVHEALLTAGIYQQPINVFLPEEPK